MAVLVCCLVAGAVVSGCGDRSGPREAAEASGGTPTPDEVYIDGPVVAQPMGTGEGLDGGVNGKVSLRNGCLLIDEYPVVWPHETTWDRELDAVRLPNGDLARTGDTVHGGGGYLKIGDLAAPFPGALQDCPSNEYGEAAVFNSQGDVKVLIDGRLWVHEATGPDTDKFPPPALQPLSSQLAELVDFHDSDFSGSWYDRVSGQVVIGVATDVGRRLLVQRGLTDDKRVRLEPARWSLREAQDILNAYMERSILEARFVTMGSAPAGDGFEIGIIGTELDDSDLQDLLTLPGIIEVSTGFTGGGGF